MAIRVRCKCGKSLKISSKYADKRIACPECRHPFRIPAAKFKSAAKAATGGEAARAPVSSPAPIPMSLDDEIAAAGSGLIGFSQSDLLGEMASEAAVSHGEAAPAALTIETAPAEVGYAVDPTARIQGARRLADPVSGPTRGFWADALVSFIYPAHSVNNVVTLGIIFFVGAIETFISSIPFFFAVGALLVIKGWFASLYLSVIQETASGSEDLPGIDLEGGWVDGIIWPALRFVGAIAVVLMPFVLLSILSAMNLTPPALDSLLPIWFLAGVFMAPMSFLLFALRSPGTLFKVHLVLTTIAKTILPYLAIWLLLAIIFVAMMVAGLGGTVLLAVLFPKGFFSPSIAAFAASTVGGILISLISIYLMIVAMRVIGLYYLHFKKRFAFVME